MSEQLNSLKEVYNSLMKIKDTDLFKSNDFHKMVIAKIYHINNHLDEECNLWLQREIESLYVLDTKDESLKDLEQWLDFILTKFHPQLLEGK